MSLLLDALKEAEKSRKRLETAPKATPVVAEEPVVLNLELDQTEVSTLEGLTLEEPQSETPSQEEPTKKEASVSSASNNDSGNTTVAPEAPTIKPATVSPTLQYHSIKDARVATDVFQNRENSKTQTSIAAATTHITAGATRRISHVFFRHGQWAVAIHKAARSYSKYVASNSRTTEESNQ